MRAVLRVCVPLAVLFAGVAFADDHVVLVDDGTDFSALRTFTVGSVSISSKHSALSSAVVENRLRDATQIGLVKRGLTQVDSQAALIVHSSVRSVEYGIDRMGRPVEQNAGRGGRRRQPNPNRPEFLEGTLVIDVIRADTKLLVWRGVYHDTDPDPSKVASDLPGHAAKLLSRFPTLR